MDRDIAIIGMAARFPEANNLKELVGNLKTGKDSVRELSNKRIEDTTLDINHPLRTLGFIEDIDKFDHQFFNISFAEALVMDPNHRLLLEVVHETIENAGYSSDDFDGSKTSVFVSDINPEYYKLSDDYLDTMVSGNSPAFIATRIARQFNLVGNASVIDTACSSSLVAVHSACNELLLNDADYALVCGSNLNLLPYAHKKYEFNIWAKDCKSRAFSIDADGMSCGEIAACILLKPLDKALQDHDHIHGVIKATAVNNNANRSSSPSAPDSISQASVIQLAWQKASINPTDIGFIEAHGSGTKLGDSLEIEGLTLAFKEYTDKKQFVPISTIKSNTGHAYGASGLAGLIKAVLSLKQKLLFPTIHFNQPNPMIDFDNSAVYVNTELKEWRVNEGGTRLAGVTSLGASGTNCHVVIAEAPPRQSQIDNREQHNNKYLFTISSLSKEGLISNMEALHAELSQQLDNSELPNISYTLNVGRRHYPFKCAFVENDIQRLLNAIQAEIAKYRTSKFYGSVAEQNKKIIFLLSDHTSIHPEQVHHLSSRYNGFKVEYEKMMEKAGVVNTQTLSNVAFEYSLYKVLKDVGITFEHVLATGVGAIVYQYISDEMTIEEVIQAAEAHKTAEITDFDQRVRHLIERETKEQSVLFIELGPSGQLSNAIRNHRTDESKFEVFSLDDNSQDSILELLRQVYLANHSVDWKAYASYYPGNRIELPTYQFERTRCWLAESPVIFKEALEVSDETASFHFKVQGKNQLKEQANQIETKIASYWFEILDINLLSVHDNFFEIGGDSLKATQVINRVKNNLNVKLDFEDIFDYCSIRSLSNYVSTIMSMEDKVAIVFKEVLKLKHIHHSDSFFALGGHSLMANQVLLRLKDLLHVSLNFDEIFKYPTPSALSNYIKANKEINVSGIITPINKVENKPHYDLSPSQRRLWVLSQFEAGSVAYNSPFTIHLKGNLDIQSLKNALHTIIDRHEIMRTVFITIDGEPKQKVLFNDEVNFFVDELDVTSFESSVDSEVGKMIVEDTLTPFPLSEGPLVRAKLMTVASRSYVLFINVHHIISDGWSSKVFLHELIELYNAYSMKLQNPLPPLSIQYKDYVEWQQQLLSGEELNRLRSYWMNQLDGDLPVLELPTDKPRPIHQTYNGDKVSIELDKMTAKRLRDLCKQRDMTLFMLQLAATYILLLKYSGQNDIIIGSPIAGRQHVELENQLGFYANTIVFRTVFEPEKLISDLLDHIKKITLQGYEHQMYPFDLLVEDVNVKRDLSRHPIFTVMLVLQNTNTVSQRDSIQLQGIEKFDISDRGFQSIFDLHIEVEEANEAISVQFTYNADLFSKDTISRMSEHYINLLNRIVDNSNCSLHEINVMSDLEIQTQTIEWNRSKRNFPEDKTIVHLFKEQVNKSPEQIAVSFDNKKMTYLELDDKSNQVATLLLSKGVGPECIVGIMLERSFEMIIGVLGILKAGGAYLPIDPSYPEERKRYIIKDSKTNLLLTTKQAAADLHVDLEMIILDDEKLYNDNSKPLNVICEPSTLAYVIYTSGSTGQPKGVMIEHVSLMNRLHWMQQQYPLSDKDVILQKTSFVFDVSVWELFWFMFSGSSICLLKPGEEKSPNEIVRTIIDNHVTVMHFVPSMLNAFLDQIEALDNLHGISCLDKVFSSGEPLLTNHVIRFNRILRLENGTKLINLYGPTEATIDVSYYDCSQMDDEVSIVPIGKPIANIQLYVLNNSLAPQPIGVVGELFIGGVGVARGYLGKPELTADKFIDNPFHKGEKLYKTGDLACWLADGNIQYIGRTDDQIKIRGFRIEPKEVQEQLLRLDTVREAVVLPIRDVSDPYLTAFYVSDSDITDTYVRNYLRTLLPEYMAPARYIRLEQIPITVNGKADKEKLYEIDGDFVRQHNEYIGPRDETELMLSHIWSEIISGVKIGIHDNFFDIGGDSIKALKVAISLQKRGEKIDLKDIFLHPTIEMLSDYMNQQKEKATEAHDRAAKVALYFNNYKNNVLSKYQLYDNIDDAYPMSDVESGLIFHSISNHKSNAHIIQYVYQSSYANFNLERFQQSLMLMIEKHSNLRAGFNVYDFNVPMKIIYKKVAVQLEMYNISCKDATSQEKFIRDFMKKDKLKGFHFDSGPIWRMSIFDLGNDEYLFLFVFHQAIMDGWSNSLFMTELSQTYFRLIDDVHYVPEKLNSTYKDFIYDQALEKMSESSKEFWRKELSGYSRLIFSNDNSRIGEFKERTSFKYDLGEEYFAMVQHIARNHSTTIKNVCFGIYVKLMHSIFNKDDIVVGALTHNRPICEDGDKLVGFFINLLPIRIKIDASGNWRQFLNDIDAKFLTLVQYEKMPLNEIAKAAGDTQLGVNPITDTIFNFTDFSESMVVEKQSNRQERSRVVSIDSNSNTNNTLFDFNVDISSGKLELKMDTAVFDMKIIDSYSIFVQDVITALYQKDDLPINSVDITHNLVAVTAANMDDIDFDF